jgi:hypothetical protein
VPSAFGIEKECLVITPEAEVVLGVNVEPFTRKSVELVKLLLQCTTEDAAMQGSEIREALYGFCEILQEAG